ncbi:hypothetical protein BC829DRAFT_44928 [Chytridium lagenaria]|nr:hypothetical protein BC829DRAFT_44928 [Chytridium lagenaria]
MQTNDAEAGTTGALPVSITSFVSDYVKSVVLDEVKRGMLMGSLKKGQPLVEETFAAVVLLDISEYSKTTSKLAAFGKIGSELITIAVGDYMTDIIQVVCQFGGDIIKFLGDAIIVAFRPKHEDNSMAIDRAIKCCLDVLRRYPSRKLDVSELLQVYSSSYPDDSSIPVTPLRIMSQKSRETRQHGSKVSQSDSGTGHDPSLSLRLHIAVTSGIVKNIILGLWENRLDYVLNGDCVSQLSGLLRRPLREKSRWIGNLGRDLKPTEQKRRLCGITRSDDLILVLSSTSRLVRLYQERYHNAHPLVRGINLGRF